MTDKLLNIDEFVRATRKTRMSDPVKEAARLVMVEGKQASEVAGQMGVTPSRVSQVIKRVWEAHEALIDVGKERVELVQADLDHMVNGLRAERGDKTRIELAGRAGTYSGPIVGRGDFHLAQEIGGEKIVVHRLAQLDVVPERGNNTRISYDGGRGKAEAIKEKPPRGHGR